MAKRMRGDGTPRSNDDERKFTTMLNKYFNRITQAIDKVMKHGNRHPTAYGEMVSMKKEAKGSLESAKDVISILEDFVDEVRDIHDDYRQAES
jgi:hypothetical protein